MFLALYVTQALLYKEKRPRREKGEVMNRNTNTGTSTAVPTLLNACELALALGCSKKKVYGLLQKRALPTVRIGRHLRVPANAFQDWLQKQLESGESGPLSL